MKKRKITRQVQLLIATGLLINSTGLMLGIIFPHMPDAVRGMMLGIGTGIILGGFMKWKRDTSVCENKEKAI
jgi:hypothetical protein